MEQQILSLYEQCKKVGHISKTIRIDKTYYTIDITTSDNFCMIGISKSGSILETRVWGNTFDEVKKKIFFIPLI